MGKPVNKMSLSEIADRHAVNLLDDALNAISLYGSAWVWCDATADQTIAPYVRAGGTRDLVCRELSDIVFEMLARIPVDEIAEQTVYIGDASGHRAIGQNRLEGK